MADATPTIALDEFKLDMLVRNKDGEFINPRIAMIASSGSGKSWVVRNIMYEMRDIPCGTIIAPTDKMTRFYDDFVPTCFINHEYKSTIIPKVLQRQRLMLKKNEERVKKGKKKLDPRAFLIMDDCMSSKHEWLKDPNVLSIFNEGRHFQLTFILTMQYCLGIQPELRSNFDFVFLLGEDIATNRRKLYEHYAGVFPKYDLFEQVFLQVTNNFGCMVIYNRLKTIDIRKKVFWFRAKKTPEFKIGSPRYIDFNKKFYDEKYEERGKYIDLMSFGSKKKGDAVRVKLLSN